MYTHIYIYIYIYVYIDIHSKLHILQSATRTETSRHPRREAGNVCRPVY